MMRLGIIINPRARRASQPGLAAELETICRHTKDLQFRCFLTHSQAELDHAMQQLAAFGIDVLAPCGGDGTLTATLSTAYRVFGQQLPSWLPLAGGTINTIARNLAAAEAPAKRLRRVLHSYSHHGELMHRPQATIMVRSDGELPLDFQTLRPRDDVQPVQGERLGFLCSAAMGARFLAAYSATPHRGLLSASLLGLRTIGSSLIPGGGPFARWLFAPTPTELVVDGREQPAPTYRLLIASTVADVGLGMKVPWLAGSVTDRFHLIASSLPLLQNVLQVPRMLRGEPMLGTPHLDALARSVTIQFAESGPVVLDGEMFCAKRLDLAIGPTLRVLSPVVAPQGLEPRTLRV
ncbi:MAG: hypothetical protein JNM83_11845 [Myxococcales bacterium]|jgi:diacylglycerol kinase family enzyme|nr:hypothetical protein [Myxococcales bacterium]